jgi:DUF2993 family protein
MARRRRHGAAVGFVVVLVVAALVAVGLWFGDRYAADRVERETAAQLQTELGTPTAPSVDVAGWPFLTQVVGRRIRSVRVIADDVGANGGSAVPVAHTDLVLTDITTDDWFQTMTAAHAEGTARLDYAALSAAAGVPLRHVGNGRVQTETTTSVFGVQVAATVTGTPQLDVRAQTISLADPDVQVAQVNLPAAAADSLIRALLKPVPVAGLPFGLTLTSLTPTDDGLQAGVQGDDIPIRR